MLVALAFGTLPALAKNDKLPPGQAKQAAPAPAAVAPATKAKRAPKAKGHARHAKATRQAAKTAKTPPATAAQLQAPIAIATQPKGQVKKATTRQASGGTAAPAASSPATTGGTPTNRKGVRSAFGGTHGAGGRSPKTQRVTVQAPAPAAATPASQVFAPIAPVSPAPGQRSSKHQAPKRDFSPVPDHARDDQPNVVLRTVSDVVEVVPTPLWMALGLLSLLALLLAFLSGRTARRARRLDVERAALRNDVGILQDAVLPAVPPRVGGLNVSVAHRPAGGPAAGGDFYDVVALPGGRVALVVGDVAGHGPGALGQATLVRFTLRAHLESGAGPREALAIAGAHLAPHFDDGFATAAVAIHDPQAGTLTYSTAAHESPIIVGPGEHEPVRALATTPLGLGDGPLARRQTVVPFPEGSRICLLTDGALEARLRGELVGRPRVASWLRELGPEAVAHDLAELIGDRAAVSDDLAVCVASAVSGAESGRWREEELHSPSAAEADRFLEACGASEEQRRAVAEQLADEELEVLRLRLKDDRVVSVNVDRPQRVARLAAVRS